MWGVRMVSGDRGGRVRFSTFPGSLVQRSGVLLRSFQPVLIVFHRCIWRNSSWNLQRGPDTGSPSRAGPTHLTGSSLKQPPIQLKSKAVTTLKGCRGVETYWSSILRLFHLRDVYIWHLSQEIYLKCRTENLLTVYILIEVLSHGYVYDTSELAKISDECTTRLHLTLISWSISQVSDRKISCLFLISFCIQWWK